MVNTYKKNRCYLVAAPYAVRGTVPDAVPDAIPDAAPDAVPDAVPDAGARCLSSLRKHGSNALHPQWGFIPRARERGWAL